MDKSSQLFINDDLFNLGSITNAVFEWFMPGNYYELIEKNGSQYIHIDNKRPNDYKRTTLEYGKISRNKDLLFDLLVCVPDILSINWNNIKPCVNLNKLFRWCHKYGLPCSEKNKIVWFENDEEPYGYVLYEPLCRIVAIICLLYHLWLAYVAEDIQKFKKVNIKIIENSEYKRLRFMLFSNPDICLKELKEHLAIFWGRKISPIQMRFVICDTLIEIFTYYLGDACHLAFYSIYQSEGTTEETIKREQQFFDMNPLVEVSARTNSPIDLCFFHLLTIFNSKGNAKHIKECQNCHEIFWARNGHSKYCPNCDRRIVWYNNHNK